MSSVALAMNRLRQPGAAKPGWLKWAIAVTVSFGALLQVIDVSIVNVSLPQMQGNLGATLSEIGWVITGYAVANAIVIPLTAWLGNYFGTKAFYIFSLVAFVATSVLCGFSTSLHMLILARVMQGFFGGGLLPRAQAILFETFPPHEQGLAQAVFGIGVIVGPTFGPTLGGYLTDTLGWRWVFFINVPVGIIGLLMAIVFLPPSLPRRLISRSVDWLGIVLLAIWLGSFQTFLEEGEGDGWFESSLITRLAIAALVGLGLFVWREFVTGAPAVDLRVLRHRSLAAGSLYAIVLGVSLYGTIFVIPIFTQRILGFTAVQTGELIIPGALASALVMPLVGRLMGKLDARAVVGTGSVLIGAAMFLLAQVNINTSAHSLFWPLLIRGLGMGCMFIPLSVATLGPIPKMELAAASGFFNLSRQIGGSIGIAMLATVLEKRQKYHYDVLIEHVSPYSPVAQQYLSGAQSMLAGKGLDTSTAHRAALALINGFTHVQAMILSFEDVYILVGVLFLISLPLVFYLGKGDAGRAPAGPAA
jgi:DHA2 family multidrug resistance protein